MLLYFSISGCDQVLVFDKGSLLHDLNPYSSPKSAEVGIPDGSQDASRVKFIRLLIYLHFAVVMYWGVFVLNDLQGISVPVWLEMLFQVRIIQVLPALLGFILPVLVAHTASKLVKPSLLYRLSISAFAFLISLVQVGIMLPLLR